MAANAEFATLSLGGLELLLCLDTVHDPTPAEWQRFLELLENAKKKGGGDISKVGFLVVTDGGAPNAKQRESMTSVAGGPFKLVAISNSLSNPIKRGITTAISWVNPLFMAVRPDQWRDGLRHLRLEGQIQTILVEFERLQRRLPPVNSLALFVAETRSSVA